MNPKIEKALKDAKDLAGDACESDLVDDIQEALDSERVVFEGWDVSLRSRGGHLLGTREALFSTQRQAEALADTLRQGDEYPSAKAVYVRVCVAESPSPEPVVNKPLQGEWYITTTFYGGVKRYLHRYGSAFDWTEEEDMALIFCDREDVDQVMLALGRIYHIPVNLVERRRES